MLRDRHFVIETDHKNLMFLKHDSNPMVLRWWTAIQELDFKVKFIAGNTNNIADALSRLCINLKENAPKITVSALIPKTPIQRNTTKPSLYATTQWLDIAGSNVQYGN